MKPNFKQFNIDEFLMSILFSLGFCMFLVLVCLLILVLGVYSIIPIVPPVVYLFYALFFK